MRHLTLFSLLLFIGGPGFLISKFSSGTIKIELSEDYYRVKWVRQFFLGKQPNLEVKWNQVISYIDEEDRLVHRFGLNLVKSIKIKFYRFDKIKQTDDFESYLKDLPELLAKMPLGSRVKVKKAKSRYEIPSFKTFLIVITIISLGMLFDLVFNPQSSMSWITLGSILTGILFYWFKAMNIN